MANHGSIGGGGVRFGGYGTLTNSGAGARIQSTDRGVFLNFGGLLTNGAGAAIIGAAKGVYGRQSESTLTNAGTVQGDAVGIQLVTGARVTNLAGGEIRSANGIGIDLAPTVYAAVSGTIANYGTISSANAQIAVRFAPGVANLLVNHSGAVFDGVVDGGNSVGAAGISTLELAAGGLGTIGGLGTGFVGFTQMTVDGGATWSMQGSNSLDAGATLANSGTLTLFMSSLTDAGALTNDGAIMLDAASLVAAKLVGSGQVTIGGGATFAATGSVASSQTILFGAGTANLLIGAGASFAATIEGFGAGDTIDLTGIVHDAGDTATLLAGNVLHLATTGGTFDLKLDPTQDFTGGLFTLSADGGGSGIGVSGVTGAATGTISTAIAATYTLAFQRTTILSTGTVSASPGPGLLGPAGAGVGWTVDNAGTVTASGGYGIDLSGDNALVTNRAGGTIVGSSYGVRLQSANGIVVNHGSLSGGTGAVVRHPNPAMVWPVRVCAGALGEGIPARDLLLSPEHAVFLDNVLVPVGLLVNGRTVVQEPCAAITYFHIELPQHDLVVAEGAACESYLDTLNRADFENAGTVITVHPEFTTETANEIWLARACAPQCRSGPALDIIRHRLELRADDAGRMTGSTRAAMA